jgi:hypothetical protein
MHINWYAGGGIMARGSAVINMPGPLGPWLSAKNFALEVYNDTLIEVLVKFATVDTPDPFLMYVSANCTVWPRADWPPGGLRIMRPVYIVGWSDAATGLDFGNGVGAASLTGRWSNVTFDSVVLENLGYGDPANPNSTVYSVISATNLWFFNASRWVGRGGGAAHRPRSSQQRRPPPARAGWARGDCFAGLALAPQPPARFECQPKNPRNEPRMVLRNSTLVLPLDIEVDTKRYWSGVRRPLGDWVDPGCGCGTRHGVELGTNWAGR